MPPHGAERPCQHGWVGRCPRLCKGSVQTDISLRCNDMLCVTGHPPLPAPRCSILQGPSNGELLIDAVFPMYHTIGTAGGLRLRPRASTLAPSGPGLFGPTLRARGEPCSHHLAGRLLPAAPLGRLWLVRSCWRTEGSCWWHLPLTARAPPALCSLLQLATPSWFTSPTT